MQQTPPQLGEGRAFGKTPEPEPVDDEEGVAASEEEQAQYDLIVSRALSLMHGEGQGKVLSALGSANSPAEGIGKVTAEIARMMKRSAEQQGKTIDDEVLLQAGAEIAEDLSELGQEAGVFEFTDEEEANEQTEEGLMWAMKYYGQDALQAGELDVGLAEQSIRAGMSGEGGGNPQVAEAVHKEVAGKSKKPGLIGSAAQGA